MPLATCPICNHPLKSNYWYGPLGIEESFEVCARCGYSYEFAYGIHIKCVKGKEFIWSYTTPRSDILFNRMRRAEYEARRNWKKHKKTYNYHNIGV